MAFFEQDGERIYFVEHGSGKSIIFLHGITNSGRAWLNQIPVFAKAGYRVIVPDLTGHGSSSPATKVTSPRDIARMIIALLDFLGVEKADCCGLSLGGAVALEAVLMRPQLFDRLIISNSFVSTASPELQQMAEGWKETFRKQDGPLLRLEGTWPVLVSQKFRQSDRGLSTFLIWHAQAARADGESYCFVTDGLAHYNLSGKLSSLQQPTLVISSSNDKISPLSNSTDLAKQIPQSEHVTIEGSEHISNVDSAALFNQIVLDFLSSKA
ncbi:MAG: alpha/beta hydrolase [Rhizobiaceae bacterium]|nr:alpha/beta hydrolase [Rhizobiaceae bacterium]